jgi:hypothetical protein
MPERPRVVREPIPTAPLPTYLATLRLQSPGALVAGGLSVLAMAAAAVLAVVMLIGGGDPERAGPGGRAARATPSGSFTSSASPASTGPSPTAAPDARAVTITEIQQVLDRYQDAYSDEDVDALRTLFADDVVRRNASEPPEDLEQALATYRSQFETISSPTYRLSGLSITPGRGEGRATGRYTISKGGGPVHGGIAFHLSGHGGRLLIDRITIRPSS